MQNQRVVLFCNNLTKENVEEKINFFMTTANCTYSESEINTMLLGIIDKLVEIKKFEFIEIVIGDVSKLTELMKFKISKKEYLYHFYIASLSVNGKYKEVVDSYEELKYPEKLKEYKEKINYNLGRAYFKRGNSEKAIELLNENSNMQSLLFLSYVYAETKDDRDKSIYDKILRRNKFLDSKAKGRIYIGYCKYYLRKEDVKKAKKSLKKATEELPTVETGFRNILFYEVANLYKEIGEIKEAIYYLKQTARFMAGAETQILYKVKAIKELYQMKYIDITEANKLLPKQGHLIESDLVKGIIESIKED